MIPFWKRLAPLGRWVVGIGGALFLLAVIGGVTSCQMARIAKIEARLSKGQTGAALASGADAVETLGKSAAAEARIDIITEENERAIRQAPGAAAPVDPAVDAAGISALCKRAAYRSSARCKDVLR